MKAGRLAMMLAVCLLAACSAQQAGQATPSQMVSPSPVEVATSTQTSAPVGEFPPDGSPEVTLSDNQGTVTMAVGERFVLSLGEMYDWNVQVEDPGVVARVQNITALRGSQGVYEALKAGRTLLSASGDPLCRQSEPPCEMPSLMFQVEVVVK